MIYADAIVEFIEEASVEIILSFWISSDSKITLWPKNITPSILKKYLKNDIAPSDDWSPVNIRVLGHTDTDFIYIFTIFIFKLRCSIIIIKDR